MKNSNLIFIFFVLSLVSSTACVSVKKQHNMSDAELKERLIGTWYIDDEISYFEVTYKADGTSEAFDHRKLPNGALSGRVYKLYAKWDIINGVHIIRDNVSVPSGYFANPNAVSRDTILYIADDKYEYYSHNVNDTSIRYRKK